MLESVSNLVCLAYSTGSILNIVYTGKRQGSLTDDDLGLMTTGAWTNATFIWGPHTENSGEHMFFARSLQDRLHSIALLTVDAIVIDPGFATLA